LGAGSDEDEPADHSAQRRHEPPQQAHGDGDRVVDVDPREEVEVSTFTHAEAADAERQRHHEAQHGVHDHAVGEGNDVPAARARRYCTQTWERWNTDDSTATCASNSRSRQNGARSCSTERRLRVWGGSRRTSLGQLHHPATRANPPTTSAALSDHGRWYSGNARRATAPRAMSIASPLKRSTTTESSPRAGCPPPLREGPGGT